MNQEESRGAKKAPTRSKAENVVKTPLSIPLPMKRGPRHPEPVESRFSTASTNSRATLTRKDSKSSVTKKNEPKSKTRQKSESFHTLPREPFVLISRKDIIRRTCSKTEDQNDPLARLTQSLRKRWRRSSLVKKRKDENCPSEEEEDPRRPRTLPSICRRSSGKDRDAPTMTLVPLTRISRQEIIRRTSSTNTEERAAQTLRRKSCGSLYNASQGRPAQETIDSRHAGCFVKNAPTARTRASDRWRSTDTERMTAQVPRPSTLPKIASSRSYKDDQHIYGNIATRSSVKDSANKQEAPIYGRIRRRKASVPSLSNTSTSASTRNGDSNSIGEATLSRVRKTYRSIRDPASDPPNYGMLDYRSVSGTSLPNLPQRTMSRRRIIDNAEEARVIKSLSRVKKDKNDDEKFGTMQANTLPSTANDHERVRRRNAMAMQKNGHWYEPAHQLNKIPVTPPRMVDRRKSSLAESCIMVEGSSKSLPSYVKKTKKASCIPLRIDRPRDDFASKSLSRLSNGVREGREPNAVRKTSIGGQSSATPYSIFGLCTGRRKVQHPVSRTPSTTEDDGMMNPYRARNPRTVRL